MPHTRFWTLARELGLTAHPRAAAAAAPSRQAPRPIPAASGPTPHLLVLTTWFSPSFQVGALRPTSLVRSAARRGWKIFVVTIAFERSVNTNATGRSRRRSSPGRTHVTRIDVSRVSKDAAWMPRTAQWFSMALEMFHRARTALRSDPPSAIVATGPQFHTFIGAYFLSRLFDVPLVLDYRDEWTLRPRFPWVSVLRDDHRWEARCLTRATRVLFVTAALRTVYLRRFPQLRNRCAVVPNGWDPRDFGHAIVRDSDARTLRLLRIGYFGFMGDHQQPRMFLRSLGRLIAADRIRKSAVRLRIVGIVDGSPYEELASFEYPSVLEPFGWMSRRRAARMMCRCSALLIFNDPLMDRALPTKLYDYLATGRPIVVYGDGRSEMKRLIERLGAGMTVAQGDDAALSRALEHVRAAPATRWRTAKRLDFLRQHTRDVTSGLMLGEIEAAMRTHAAQRRSGV